MIGVLFIVAAIVLLPMPALAFGPIAHLDMGLELLGTTGLFAAGVARLLRRHPEAFLHGTLDPDRSLAKNLAPYHRHSHNWQHALRQYRAARGEDERAAFLGYMCHLAADAVAHNGFVPCRLVEAWRNPAAGHLYWEMRFDAQVRRRTGASLLWLANPDHPEHQAFLRRTVLPSVPGKGFHLHVTRLVLRVQRGRAYGSAWDLLDRRSRLGLDGAEVDRTRELALDAQRSILRGLGDAGVLQIDPRGLATLKDARAVRHGLRDLRRGGADREIASRIEEAQSSYRDLVLAAAGPPPDAELTGDVRAAILA